MNFLQKLFGTGETEDEEYERLVDEGMIVAKNFEYCYQKPLLLETIKGDYDEWEKFMLKHPRLVTYIGGRRTGKSAGCFNIAENLAKKKGKIIQTIGMDGQELPVFISNIASIEEVENDSILVVGEGAIEANARNSMGKSNKNLASLLPIISHKNVDILWATQAGYKTDKNLIYEADTLILLKPSLMQLEVGGERPAVIKLYKKYKPYLDKWEEKIRTHTGLAIIHSEKFEGVIRFKLPAWWNDELSKSYANKEVMTK